MPMMAAASSLSMRRSGISEVGGRFGGLRDFPWGNGLRFHSLTSCRFVERHAFPRAPFRYPASGRAVLSNNFLEVGYNFLGLAVGPVRFVRGIRQLEASSGRRAKFFSEETKLNRNKRVKLQ
jgi:hypothetical protein